MTAAAPTIIDPRSRRESGHRAGRRGTTRPLSVAPMMDRTDRHCRVLLRLLSRHTLLYTEMVTTGALIHGDHERHLGFDEIERPLALQLGGDDPEALSECARMAADRGYDEVNLNVGCPSDRVQNGSFGACLMAHPDRVARAVEAMRAAVDLPVTVKHRIGIDHLDSYEHLRDFVDTVAKAGSDRFSVHARIAWLQGLSPKENRTVPPLRYDDVYRLKRERPQLVVEINGGITSLDQTEEHLHHVDAVMIGRAAWDEPWLFADADRRFFDPLAVGPTRGQVVARFLEHTELRLAAGDLLHHIAKPLFNLFAGQPGARAFRRHLSENLHRPGASPEVILDAVARIDPAVLERKAQNLVDSSSPG